MRRFLELSSLKGLEIVQVTAVVNLEGGKIITVQKAKKDSEKSTKVFFLSWKLYAVDKPSADDDDEGDAIRKIRWEHRGAMWDVEHHRINDVHGFP